MADPVSWVAIGSMVVSAAGAGMSYYSQNQQAENAERMAEYNAAVQQQNAEVQAAIMRRQYEANAAIAQANYQNQQSAAAVHDVNATVLRQQGDAVLTQGLEQIRRKREEYLRVIGSQRSGYAKGGVMLGAGSPLAALAEAAGIMELNRQDAYYAASQERNSYYWKARIERYNGELVRQGSAASLIEVGSNRFMAAAADAQRGIALRQADLDRLAGASYAKGLRQQANATLVSSAGSMMRAVA